MSTLERPQLINDLIDAHQNKKLYTELYDKLRVKAIELLKLSEFPGVKFRVDTKEFIQEAPFLSWAHETLPKKEYERLFVKTFDPNMVVVLAQQGIFKMSDVPADAIKVTKTSVVTVTEKG